MKKKIIGYSLLGVLALAIAIFGVWYYTPKTFLGNVRADEVRSISVFNGSTGKHFEIVNAEEIKAVVENIQSMETERDKMAVHYDGFGFSLKFFDTDGNEIDAFIINSKNTVRDGSFFYRTETDGLCFDYLCELEKMYASESDALDWGISFSVKNVTGDGLTLICKRSPGYADGELQTGSDYVIESLQNDTWIEAVRLQQDHDIAWTGEAWHIPQNHTVEWDVDWEWLYGNLSAGQYRIGKEIMNFRATDDFDTAWAYAEFIIE